MRKAMFGELFGPFFKTIGDYEDQSIMITVPQKRTVKFLAKANYQFSRPMERFWRLPYRGPMGFRPSGKTTRCR